MKDLLVLSIRTDRPDAELGLFDDNGKVAYSKWLAHRQLAETIHVKLKELLESQGRALKDLGAVVVFKGPGSFTGLRIGISVANTLSDSLGIPIVSGSGPEWIDDARARLAKGHDDKIVKPDYGADPHVTEPRK